VFRAGWNQLLLLPYPVQALEAKKPRNAHSRSHCPERGKEAFADERPGKKSLFGPSPPVECEEKVYQRR